MKKTLIAIMLALALVLIPAGNAFAIDLPVVVTASPAILAFTVTPNTWDIMDTGLINRNTYYYSNDAGNTIQPTTPTAGECRFEFENTGDVTIDITVNMADFMKVATPPTVITYMLNKDGGGYTDNDETHFGAAGYAVGTALPGVPFLTTGSGVFINDLPATGADKIKWGIALRTQTDSFLLADEIQSIVTCTAVEI